MLRIQPDSSTTKHTNLKLIYFHSPGQFLGPIFKQELFVMDPLDFLDSNKFFQLDLNHVHALSTEDTPCSKDYNVFDDCVKSKALNSTLEVSGCLPPFVDTSGSLEGNISWCLNNSKGEKSFKTYLKQVQAAKRFCLPPCMSYSSHIVFKNNQNIIGNMVGGDLFYSLFISFPSVIQSIKSDMPYGWISYVAELSGWIGLCLGLSVPSVLGSLLSMFEYKTIVRKLKNVLPYTMFLLFLLFLRQIWLCVTKFLARPSASNIFKRDNHIYM